MNESLTMNSKEYDRLHDSELMIGSLRDLIETLASASMDMKDVENCAWIIMAILEYTRDHMHEVLEGIAGRYKEQCA